MAQCFLQRSRSLNENSKPKTYLYKKGEEFIPLTGGFEVANSTYGSLTKNPSSMTVECTFTSESHFGKINIRTKNKISIPKNAVLFIKFKEFNSNGDVSSASHVTFYASTNPSTNGSDFMADNTEQIGYIDTNSYGIDKNILSFVSLGGNAHVMLSFYAGSKSGSNTITGEIVEIYYQ